MEEEKNINTNTAANVSAKEAAPRHRSRYKWQLIGGFAALVVLALAYLGVTNPQLFRAALTELTAVPAGQEILYIPSYSAPRGETGTIDIRAQENAGEINSMEFVLRYEPTNALIFTEGDAGVVLDDQTAFPSADFRSVTRLADGQVKVQFGALNAVSVPADPVNNPIVKNDRNTHKTIARLALQVNPEIPEGTEIKLSVSGLDVSVPDPVEILKSSTVLTAMSAGTITVEGVNKLRVLNAETLDPTHIRVNFSDSVTEETGDPADYMFSPALTVTAVERGDRYNSALYDSKTVILTTASQTIGQIKAQLPGQAYELTVSDQVEGAVEGKVNPSYSQALVFGHGEAAGVLSDFGMVSAVTNDYRHLTITFTDPVAEASVKSDQFEVKPVGGASLPVLNATTSGNQITLTVDGNLVKGNGYLVTHLNPLDPKALQRASDGAKLGMNSAVFSGYKKGPRVTGAAITLDVNQQPTLNIIFDEPVIAEQGDNYGWLYKAGPNNPDPVTQIDVAVDNVSSISFSNFPVEDDTRYVFVANNKSVKNLQGVPVAESDKTVTLWGPRPPADPNAQPPEVKPEIGAASVIRKNTIEVDPGDYSFNGITENETSLFYFDADTSRTVVPLTTVEKVASGKLNVVTTSPLAGNRDYVLHFADPANPAKDYEAVSFAIESGFDLLSAEAIAKNQLTVDFSENVDVSTISSSAFEVYDLDGSPITIDSGAGIPVDPTYRRATLTLLKNELLPGNIYEVIGDEGSLRSYTGKPIGVNAALLRGYRTKAVMSDVKVTSAKALSQTSLRLSFSAPVDEATFLNVNFKIQSLPLNGGDTLTVTDIKKVNDTTYELTTSRQKAGVNYFITFDGVMDTEGRRLANEKVTSFFGFEVPAAGVLSLSPNVLVNDQETVVVISGQNLNTITKARLDNTELTISDQPASGLSLSVTVPAGLSAGTYDFTLENEVGEQIVRQDALIINEPVIKPQVVSDESRANPYRVRNDGEMETKLAVRVYDPQDFANIDAVTVNLSEIQGGESVDMVPGPATDDGGWFLLEDVTVPPEVNTKEEPYLLPVDVRKGNQHFKGTISLIVTKDIYGGVAPTVSDVYVNPSPVSPDGVTEITISARVSDPDGITNMLVEADLGPLIGRTIILKPGTESATAIVERTTESYISEPFTVPNTTAEGKYNVSVIATDETGEAGTATVEVEVSTALTGPKITEGYLAPANSVVRDGKTPFSLHVFVEDKDGLSDITSVTADFGPIGLPPVILKQGTESAVEGATSGWFSAEGLTIPTTALPGLYTIRVRATDKSSATATLSLEIDVTHKDVLGDPPRIIADRNYTTPKVAINDGETPITLYAFVRDDDDNIESVVVNLSQIGQVGPEQPAGFTESNGSAQASAGGGCPTNSKTLVCMQPSVKEGIEGQWFILPGVTISKDTAPGSEPYQVEVVVTDATKKTTRGTIPVSVNDGESFTNDKFPPELVLAVATGPNTVEALFSEELSANSISPDGREFEMVDRNDVNRKLAITGATISANGTIVTLTTETQTPGRDYVLIASSNIRDSVGVALVPGAANRAPVSGFAPNDNPPVVEYIGAVDSETFEIEFRDYLRPSSLKLAPVTEEPQHLRPAARGARDFNIEIYESGGTSAPLPVYGVQFVEEANLLQIKTAPQKSNQRYRVVIRDLQSYAGTAPRVGINKLTRGFNTQAVQRKVAAQTADLNGDGRVDFTDFTIFSAVYGTSYVNPVTEQEEAPAEVGGRPHEPEPDSTVPPTSEPAGGEIPAEGPPATSSIPDNL